MLISLANISQMFEIKKTNSLFCRLLKMNCRRFIRSSLIKNLVMILLSPRRYVRLLKMSHHIHANWFNEDRGIKETKQRLKLFRNQNRPFLEPMIRQMTQMMAMTCKLKWKVILVWNSLRCMKLHQWVIKNRKDKHYLAE